MEKIITTLPLSPQKNTALGYYSVPLLADVIASFMNTRVVHAVNVLGTKGHTRQDANMHFAMLRSLGISSQLQWNDADEQWDVILSRLFYSGSMQGWVLQDKRIVMVCPCGKVEFLANTSTLSEIHGTRKVYKVHNGEISCLLCSNRIIPRTIRCLLVRLPNQVPNITITPKYASVEWNQLAREIVGREILVSRIRETGVRAEFKGKHFNIDVDFAWKLLLERLRAKELQCSCMIVGHKTIKHALSVVLLSSLIDIPTPGFVIATPYFSLDFGNKPVQSARELIHRHGEIPLRWLLGMMLGCTRKEITLQSKLIHLIAHSVGVTLRARDEDPKLLAADALWKEFNAQRIQRMLSQMRRGWSNDLAPIELHLASILGLTLQTL